MQPIETGFDSRKRRRILARHERANVIIAERRIKVEIEEMRRHGIGKVSECGHVLERRSNFGRTPEAVTQHTGYPIRIGGARTHHARNLLGQRASMRLIGTRRVEVIEQWSGGTEPG
jgi:hypothetical protein